MSDEEFVFIAWSNKDEDVQTITLPPIILKIEKRIFECGSMLYFPPFDDDDEDDEIQTLFSERSVWVAEIPWGDIVPGSVIQINDDDPPEELILVRVRWSMFNPGLVLYFSGSEEIPSNITSHPMVFIVPWI